MLRITLRQMEYAVAVAEHGSLTDAAAALNISQPSLSVAISQVEAHLNAKLFVRRKGARLIVTPRGKEFVAEAAVLIERAGLLEDPHMSAAVTKSVRLGIFEDLAPQYLAPILQAVRKETPGINLIATVSDFETLASEVQAGQVDISITYDLGLDASFDRTILRKVAPYAFFAVSNVLAGRRAVALKEIIDQPLILFEEGLSFQHFLQLFKSQGLRPQVAHRVKSLEVMRSLAANGEGVGLSYTVPPSALSYDGNKIAVAEIREDFAAEAIVLVSSALMDLSQSALKVREIVERAPYFRT